MLIKGKDLTGRQREQVLGAYIYRWTTGNSRRLQMWRGLMQPTIPLISDDEWIRDHAFHFVLNGSRLTANHRHAELACMAD